MSRWRATLCVTVLLIGACGPRVRHARTSFFEGEFPRERDARERFARRSSVCKGGLILVPGVGQMCQGRTAEGAIILALGAAELATGVAVAKSQPDGVEHPAAAVPLIAFQDLWLYSLADVIRDVDLAKGKLFVPQDSLAELVVAPFNGNVLKRPSVWAGTALFLALGIGVSLLVDETVESGHVGDDANVFGLDLDPEVGYPLAAGVGAGLFTHVAIAEEMAFRGYLQSYLARTIGETSGWVWASVLFGLVHATNAIFLPENERVAYLAIGVPYITLTASYLGLEYRWNDYSLTGPVAIHFWYNFLLSATFFLLNPQDSPLSARIALPF